MKLKRVISAACAACLALVVALCEPGLAQDAGTEAGTSFDKVALPGKNYDKAEFRMWLPAGLDDIRAVVVLMPGSNGDGRSEVNDPVWRAFATRERLALIGVRLTDKPHEQPFIEQYANVSEGSGRALLDALVSFAKKSQHAELATAPLLLWGMSAGGEFNYEFVAWRPERVIGFIVNKGGIYFTALTSPAARRVPGLLFIGGKDLDSRKETIRGLFALNRRAGALWALAEEPSARHEVGRSREMAIIFFAELLPLRLPEPAASKMASPPSGNPSNAHDGSSPANNPADPSALRPLAENSGFVGDANSRTFWKIGERDAPNYPTAWLPTRRVAQAWQAMLAERPFPE